MPASDRASVEAKGPLQGGLPDGATAGGDGDGNEKRLDGANPFGDTLFTNRNWDIVDVVKLVAADIGETPARVALAWMMSRPGVDTTLIGVSKVAQVHDNIAALDLNLGSEQLAALDAASRPPSSISDLSGPIM